MIKRIFIYGSWLILLIVIILRVFHVPGALTMFSFWIIINIGDLIIVINQFSRSQNKQNHVLKLLSLVSISLWLFYIGFRLFYFVDFILLFIIALVLSLASMVLVIQRREFKSFEPIISIFILGCCIIFFLKPNSEVYYMVYLYGDHNESFKEHNPAIWDKYSWYLYQEGDRDEALRSNTQAMDIQGAETWVVQDEKGRVVNYDVYLKEHREAIASGDWAVYNSYLFLE